MRHSKKSVCHCGSVELKINFDNGLENIRRCGCSLCSRKGYVMASVPTKNVSIIKGEELLTLYQFDSMTAEHYFCCKCGVHTHHKRRSNPQQYGINIACIEGVNPLTIKDIPIGNGGLNLDFDYFNK
ncbi:GFA family protein [Marinomonas sp. C2222]|uniref:GFA family protein n=1 Tax=Marinomonas sargassi TaxID=2984494 RepID=A0ABT2YQR4_9GAMM|nr:GFA family protein [Marinomonas sargassi]MCV2402237.1 GFA family protein [Marinomonas sargassi]